MPSHFFPTPPDQSPTAHFSLDAVNLQRLESLREATHRTQRAFVFVNGVPLVAGVTLSSFTDIPAIHVYGKLNLGFAYGILQCFLFIATSWLYETRSTRWCDPIEQSVTSGTPRAEASSVSRVNKSWR